MRKTLSSIITHRYWEIFIITLIVINAITLGLETSPSIMNEIGPQLKLLDKIFLSIFIVEIIMRIYVHRLAFFRDPWSIFDFTIVAISVVPAGNNVSVLRAFRVLRALRLITAVPSMRRVVSGLLHAMPGMGSITLLLLLIFYVFSVMATTLFAQDFPKEFGSIALSAYTLFQIMTLDAWSSEVVRPVMEVYPLASIFFIIFILVTSFTVLNLFIGIIVDAMYSQSPGEAKKQQTEDKMDQSVSQIIAEINKLREEIRELKKAPDQASKA